MLLSILIALTPHTAHTTNRNNINVLPLRCVRVCVCSHAVLFLGRHGEQSNTEYLNTTKKPQTNHPLGAAICARAPNARARSRFSSSHTSHNEYTEQNLSPDNSESPPKILSIRTLFSRGLLLFYILTSHLHPCSISCKIGLRKKHTHSPTRLRHPKRPPFLCRSVRPNPTHTLMSCCAHSIPSRPPFRGARV